MSKVAIITGGGSGLGQSTAVRLAKEGVHIVVVDVSEKGGNETVEKVKAHGVDVVFLKADVSKVEEVKNYVDRTVEHFGQIDYFFNNAGISGSGKYFLETDIQEIEQIVGINLLVKSRALMVRARLFWLPKALDGLRNQLFRPRSKESEDRRCVQIQRTHFASGISL